MADEALQMQNQLKFNLGIPLMASNITARYQKPRPIIVERAGAKIPSQVPAACMTHPSQAPSSARSSVGDDKMALAVRLAQRDLRMQREGRTQTRSRSPSPKSHRPRVTKGGTKIIQTREAKTRAQRLQAKQTGRDPLKVREQGWNSGTGVPARTQTPPRSRRPRFDLPATTNSPPTRDTDGYRRAGMTVEPPGQEIVRLQKEIENYLQHIQVLEQKAMREQLPDSVQPAKSRKKEGYLDEEEDPARKALRLEEQATRAARQLYFLRQQVRALQEEVTGRGNKVKHTKKSQVMLRLAAAHRGAVRAIQGFVNQQLPQQDLRRGLPPGYHELSLLIKQLVLISTQIKGDQDTSEVHEDLLRMLDRVSELNRAWVEENSLVHPESVPEMRHKSPPRRQGEGAIARPNVAQKKRLGKENKPKGLLKKQFNRGTKTKQSSQRPRQVTPERQNILRAGLEALVRDRASTSQNQPSVAWEVSANESAISGTGNPSLILPKALQHKRERAQKSVGLAVPESHFTDPTLASSLKTKTAEEASHDLVSRDPWRPGGRAGGSPSRSRSRGRSRSQDPDRSQDRRRSYSPRSRDLLVQDLSGDAELFQELFPQGVDGQGAQRPRSASPRSRSQRQRSTSPRSRSPRMSRFSSHAMQTKLKQMQQGAKNTGMVRGRQQELSEINIRQMLAERAVEKAELSGEILTEMILNDLLRDTAEELQSLEGDEDVEREAAAVSQNPTLENMFQRLEQMELEQLDIRRRWGTLQFEDENYSSIRKVRQDDVPGRPVAMEITKQRASQSLRQDTGRGPGREEVRPIIFTNTVPTPREQPQGEDYEGVVSSLTQRNPFKTKLRMSETLVKEIKGNLERYERHLRKTSHQSQGKFDPWHLVEEIADHVLDECVRDIDKELEDIGENIIHQLCRSEFAVPDPNSRAEVAREEPERLDAEQYTQFESANHSSRSLEIANQSRGGSGITGNVGYEEVIYSHRDSERESARQRDFDVSLEQSEKKSRDKSVKKEVSFDQDVTFEREAIFDADELEMATPRDVLQEESQEYDEEDDEYEDEEDDEDDVEEVSPIDSEDLEYSTDET